MTQASDETLLDESTLFDASWYSQEFPDVGLSGIGPSRHYLRYGPVLGRNPSPGFDACTYLEQNEDVSKVGINPLLHYLKYGRQEGRPIRPLVLRDEDKPRDVPSLLESPLVFEAREVSADVRARLLEQAAGARVSVVMPTWNRRDIIARALRSALGQALAPSEIIVADDGSSDGTLAMLELEFADEVANGRLVLLSGPRGGVSHARNRGLERATGEFIAYLDSDNEWHPDHLLHAIGVLAGLPDAGCAYTAVRVNHAGVACKRILGRRFDRTRLLRGNFIDLNAFVHRRGLYLELGGFDRSLRRLVDWDLVIRYTAATNPVHVPVVTVEYYLDSKAYGNITFTEKIEQARDTIFVKHREDYVAHGILTDPQVDRVNERLLSAMAATAETVALATFNVVLSSRMQQSRLPDLSGLDVATIVWLRESDGYRALASTAPGVPRGSGTQTLPEGVYWCPDPAQPVPHLEQLRALFLAISTGAIDFAAVSYSLAGEGISASCLRNQVVVSDRLVRDWLATDRPLRLAGYRGKVLRMPPSPVAATHQVALSTLLGEGVEVDKKDLLLHERSKGAGGPLRRRDALPTTGRVKRKPVVLVLPMKVAVGGVERNTVEIMRALRHEYDFIYVTMEKIFPEQGSLAAQVIEVAHRFIDLAEISTHEHYIDLLRMLKASYRPDVAWICNGSMWMCRNAMGVREVFDDVPIVDQQVYDVTEGWIRRYTEPGIQSFDRFIAINSRIRDRFIGDFGMDPGRVDLIYSAIDSAGFRQRKATLAPPSELRAKFRLPEGRKCFAFMGRLVDQKRPLDFLELAARRTSRAGEHYVLVGNGNLASRVEAWLGEHPECSVQWIPYVENTAEFWSVMDGMIVTSAFEGLPIAMLEALAMEVPVLSTDVGDIAPVLAEHKAGMVVERIGDPEAFAARMDGFVAQLPDFRAHLVVESERVLERFSSQAISRQYRDCWQAAIAQRIASRGASA